MKYEEIPPINVSSGVIAGKRTPSPLPEEQSNTLSKDQIHQDKVNPTQLDHIQLSKIDAFNAESMSMSIDIRDVNQAMASINNNLQQMQSVLEGIVKIYPPYPPGSSERIEALRQFSTLRKMIDQIAQPTVADGLVNILGDPLINPQSGDWTIKKINQGSDLIIKHQPVHTGKNGLDIPDIDINSSDPQITSVLNKLSLAIETLHSRHRSFNADANRVISSIA